MKPKNLLYLTTTLCFTTLFYSQGVGLNYLLFAIILVANSLIIDKEAYHSQQWKIVATALLFSAFFTMYYGNALTITMTLVSFLIFLIIKNYKKASILTALLGGLILQFASLWFILLGLQYRMKLNAISNQYNRVKNHRWIPIIAVVMVSIIFLSLYCAINPVFANYTSEIIGRVSWGWLFFTLFGTILLYTLYYPPRIMRKVLKMEEKIDQEIHEVTLSQKNTFLGNEIDYKSEKLTATIMFAVLNTLLFFLNSTDINYLFIKSALPYSLTLSDYVHNGVGAVITSIIFAILLILFYYRGVMNFDKKSRSIKILTYIWIAQNIVLVAMTIFKNQLYIDAYALTYKRIGVYYYLFFAITGLLFTAYKLKSHKTAWFLIKSNSLSIYSVLVISCVFNWNMIVTDYNIKRSNCPDYAYLSELGYENYPTLWVKGAFESKKTIPILLNLTSVSKTYLLPEEVADFLKTYEEIGMQSFCMEKKKTYDFFMKLAKEDKIPLFFGIISKD